MVPMPSFKLQCAFNLEIILLSTIPELDALSHTPQQVQLLQQAARWVTNSWAKPVTMCVVCSKRQMVPRV